MSEGRCQLKDCPVAENGDCLEGLPLSTCPNYLPAAEGDEEIAPGEVKVEPLAPEPQSVEYLPSGDYLSGQPLATIMQRAPCTVVVIAGEVACGKTTLLVGLYEAFQQGRVADFEFAGSETLVAFEKRSHLSRIESGLAKADTERTRREQVLPFLHLALERNGLRQHLLLSDLSGEVFSDIADSQVAATRLTELRRADHFLIILDGERLTDLTERQRHVVETATAIRSLVQANMLRANTSVHLVVSKWDLIEPKIGEVEAFLEQALARLTSHVSTFSVMRHRIAARSEPKASVEEGWGLSALLTTIAERRPPRAVSPDAQRSFRRVFLNYGQLSKGSSTS
jgi:hypothetical protein